MSSDIMDIDGSSYRNSDNHYTHAQTVAPTTNIAGSLKRKFGETEREDIAQPEPPGLYPSVPNPQWYFDSLPKHISPRTWATTQRQRRNHQFDTTTTTSASSHQTETRRRIGGMLTTIYSGASLLLGRLWKLIAPTLHNSIQDEQEIVAVETDMTGAKRRAIATAHTIATNSSLQRKASTGEAPAPAQPSSSKHPRSSHHNHALDHSATLAIPGQFPDSEIFQSQAQHQTHQGKPRHEQLPKDDSWKSKMGQRHSVPQTRTPPDSRPGSSQEQHPKRDSPMAELSDEPRNPKNPLAASSSPTRKNIRTPDSNDGNSRPPSHGGNVKSKGGPSVDDMYSQIRQMQIDKGIRNADGTINKRFLAPALPNKAHRTTLPLDSFPAVQRKKIQQSKDDHIETLIVRGRRALAESPEQRQVRQHIRRLRDAQSVKSKKAQLAEEEAQAEKEAQKTREKEDEARVPPGRTSDELDKLSKLEIEPIEKELLIRPLNDSWSDKVASAMASKPAQALASGPEGNSLTRADLGTLLPQPNSSDNPIGWLNDEIVNAWFSWICAGKVAQAGWKKPAARQKSATAPPYAAYNSAWLKAVRDKDSVTAIARWSKRKHIAGTDLLTVEKIFFPVNTGAHWTLLVISPQARTIEYLDSMSTRGAAPWMQIAREWLAMELGEKGYIADEWRELATVSEKQGNSNDCGVFVCCNGFAIAKDVGLAEVQQKSMPNARRMMTAVLLNEGFKGDWEL